MHIGYVENAPFWTRLRGRDHFPELPSGFKFGNRVALFSRSGGAGAEIQWVYLTVVADDLTAASPTWRQSSSLFLKKRHNFVLCFITHWVTTISALSTALPSQVSCRFRRDLLFLVLRGLEFLSTGTRRRLPSLRDYIAWLEVSKLSFSLRKLVNCGCECPITLFGLL